MKVAITGASGSIASYVIRELTQHGHETIAVGRNPPASANVPFRRASIDDAGALARAFNGADAVVHLAAITSPYRAGAGEVLRVNVQGTVNVLEAGIEARIARVVFASSGAATGFSFPLDDRAPRYLPLDEAHPCEPDDSYGLSKLVGEAVCARWSRAHRISTICLRISSNWYVDRVGAEAALHGGWARGLSLDDLWQRYRLQLERPQRPRTGDAPPLPRDLLYAVTDARDAAEAFRLALEADRLEHDVFLINGFDTCSLTPSEELVAEQFPGVPVRAPLPGFSTLVSHAHATALLGYEPRHTWRESDFADWLGRQGSLPE
jgi:nucleoside-diphosphate-sugar epimerase